ncbi:MAG: GspE/PulE family protein [Minisyncoccia bacterium]
MDILQILVQKGALSEKEVSKVEKEATNTGATVEEVLIKRGISPQDILSAKGQLFDIPVRNADDLNVSSRTLDYIPKDSATYYRFVPLDVKDGVLEVGMVDPDNIESRNALNFISAKIQKPVKIFLITEEGFNKILSVYKGLTSEVSKSLSEIEVELKADPKVQTDEKSASDIEDSDIDSESKEVSESAPVTKIVATILRYATDGHASDIHIEPWRENVKVRFRVDGVMSTSLVLPLKVHLSVVARIKLLSKMRLDEKRKPQDGRFTAHIDNRKVDFRVSTFPTYFGEKVVMRLLDQEAGVKKLDDMGLSKKNLDLIRNAMTRPFGLILISGPTGSGKTTTLYSMLNEVDREHLNVLSLEDPIEYNIEGMSQSQVRPEIGYTFATGLRTTLRQDPDVIMVGEIRDKETAQLAIQAALTGHLVLSTIHTNSAAGVIPRLLDMEVDPYLIAPTLIIAIAQRLVSQLCPNGGIEMPIEGSLKLMIDDQFKDLPQEYIDEIDFTDKVYSKSETLDCPSGTRGRLAVMEVMEVDKNIEEVILKNANENEIMKAARSKGMLTMKEDAIIKAMHRIIPFEEINTL